MIFDIHSHVIFEPNKHNNYLCEENKMSYGLKLLSKKIKKLQSNDKPEDLLIDWINKSTLDKIVLLALDPVYSRQGMLDMNNTKVIVNNDFVYNLSKKSSKILFGASIHPYRKDALEELKRLSNLGASLIKWIPSAQNISTDDKICIPFYEALKEYKIPLLTHIGVEHAIPTFSHELNDPRKLKKALDIGVTVIAAHCGTRMFLHEKSYFKYWKKMALEYENFYGDISTFTLPLRYFPLKTIKNNKKLLSKILYASDFPAISWPLWYTPSLGLKNALNIHKIKNPFDKPYFMMKRLGLPDDVFSRAKNILNLKNNLETNNK